MGGLFFNDSISIEAFHCIECKKILKPPIILTPKGNMCLHHDNQNGDTLSSFEVEPALLRNHPLEEIMEHITCTCRYRGSGCEAVVHLNRISEHEEFCKFKTFTCLLPGCEWSGIEPDYVSHLHEHTDYIDRGSDGMFQLECGTEGTDNVSILRTISGLSLLHIKVLQDKLICAVYDIENQYTESYKIWMTSPKSLGKIHYEYPCQIVDSCSRFKNFESVLGNKIKFDTLNPVNNKKVTVCLEHVFKGEIVSSELDDSSKYDNHLLKLLEKIQIRLPCGNASLGCREQHTPESQHENTSCHYKRWKCPAEINCQFEGLFTDLVDHIENNHDSIRHNETTVPLNLSSHKIAFIVYGNIFILEYKNTLAKTQPLKPMIESSGTLPINFAPINFSNLKLTPQNAPKNEKSFSLGFGSQPSLASQTIVNIEPTFGGTPPKNVPNFKLPPQNEPKNEPSFSLGLGSQPTLASQTSSNIQPTSSTPSSLYGQPSSYSRSYGSKPIACSQPSSSFASEGSTKKLVIKDKRTEQKSFDFSQLDKALKPPANTDSIQTFGGQELSSTFQSCPWMKWQVWQVTNRSGSSANFGLQVTVNSTDGMQSFNYNDRFKKNSLNEYRCQLLLTNSVLETLVPQCTEAKIKIVKMKK